MKTKAAVLTELGKPLQIETLDIPSLKAGQVLIDMHYSGVCFTQVMECLGMKGPDPFLPHCLGHEGSGVVKEIGEGVTKVKIGDRVILSWMKGSGQNIMGTVYQSDKLGKVNSGAVTTFSEYTVVSENRLTVWDQSLSPETALLGCAVPTGMGAVSNTLKPSAGQSILIFGIGGVGACSVMAASLAGCWPIVCVDLSDEKLTLAKKLGASHTLKWHKDIASELKTIAKTGFDFAVDCTGRTEVTQLALSHVRSQGGKLVVVGNSKAGDTVSIDPKEFNQGKQLLGTWGGDNNPDIDFPRYMKLFQAGKLPLEFFVGEIFTLDQVNEAIEALKSGRVLRPILRMK